MVNFICKLACLRDTQISGKTLLQGVIVRVFLEDLSIGKH